MRFWISNFEGFGISLKFSAEQVVTFNLNALESLETPMINEQSKLGRKLKEFITRKVLPWFEKENEDNKIQIPNKLPRFKDYFSC